MTDITYDIRIKSWNEGITSVNKKVLIINKQNINFVTEVCQNTNIINFVNRL